jgi:TolA-binding protein
MRNWLLIIAVMSAASLRAETAAALFAGAEAQYQKGDYEGALNGYRDVVKKFPDDWRANQARFTEGFILQKKLKKLDQARDAFQKVAESNSASALTPHALYHIANVDEQSGDTDKAIKAYSEFIAKAAGHPREKNAKRKLEFLKRHKENPKEVPPGWAHGMKKRWYRKMLRDIEPKQPKP